MKKLWILIVLIQFACPAFENAFKFQYLGDNLPSFQDSVKTGLFKKSVVLIVPFSQPYLKLASMNFSHLFSAGVYELYLISTGDKLYHESMMENKFDFSIHNNNNLAVLMNSYLISIQNYSTYYAFSTGFRLMYSNPKYVSYFIEYKNGYFITQSNLNPNVPEIIHISFFHINYKSQFVFSLVKDMSFPVGVQLSWKNILHPILSLNFGFINSSREIMGGAEFHIGEISPFIFILNHPNLGITYGFKISFWDFLYNDFHLGFSTGKYLGEC